MLTELLKESLKKIKEGEDYDYIECMRYILKKYPEFKNSEARVLEPFWDMHREDIMGRVEGGENKLDACLEEFEEYLSNNPEISGEV